MSTGSLVKRPALMENLGHGFGVFRHRPTQPAKVHNLPCLLRAQHPQYTLGFFFCNPSSFSLSLPSRTTQGKLHSTLFAPVLTSGTGDRNLIEVLIPILSVSLFSNSPSSFCLYQLWLSHHPELFSKLRILSMTGNKLSPARIKIDTRGTTPEVSL